MRGAEIARPPVHRITLAQLAILITVCPLLWAYDPVVAWSLAAGGLVAVLPQAYFAALAFRRSGAGSARVIAHSGYVGEVGKFLLSAVGFAVVFAALRPLHGPAVFAAYVAMLAIQIFGSWLLLTRPVR